MSNAAYANFCSFQTCVILHPIIYPAHRTVLAPDQFSIHLLNLMSPDRAKRYVTTTSSEELRHETMHEIIALF